MIQLFYQVILVLIASLEINGNCFHDPFNGISSANTLKFSGLIFSHLPTKFVTSDSAKYVILQNNGIKTIAGGAFSGLPQMTTLDLSNNSLSPKNFFTFGYHNNIEAIILDNNFDKTANSTDLEIKISNYYPKLKYLSLRNVGLKIITSDIQKYLILSYLDLSNNNLNHTNVLDHLPGSLQSLCMENTGLTNTSQPLKNSLNNVHNISFSNNKIGKITFIKKSGECYNQSLCLYLPSVRNFIASNCNVSSFVVEGNQITEKIDLSRNQIIELKNTTLIYLPYLKSLNISNNPLSHTLVLPLLPRLEVLFMDNVDPKMVKSFLNTVFFTKIKQLSLSGNSITNVSASVLKNHINLVELNLSNNLLTSLNLAQGKVSNSLKHVNVSDNYIENFSNVQLTNHLSFHLLDIRRNPLTKFNVTSLAGLPRSTNVLFSPNCS